MRRTSRWLGTAGGLVVAAALGSDARRARPDGSVRNVVPLTVRTPHGGFNRLVIDVTLCEPDRPRCATIPDVMVDTGSTGLRIEASAMPSRLRLPASRGADGKPIAECLRIVHDVAWGPLLRAGLRLGGEVATDLPIQLVADHDPSRPAGCPPPDARPTSNGTVGLGPNTLDCADPCRQDPDRPVFFARDAEGWTPLRAAKCLPPVAFPTRCHASANTTTAPSSISRRRRPPARPRSSAR